MAIRVVRLGTPRGSGEGLRLGTVRRPPRGVKKADFARRDYYDQWLPVLAPSQPVVSWALSVPWTDERWAKYAEEYREEMSRPVPRQLIALLAAMSRQINFSVGRARRSQGDRRVGIHTSDCSVRWTGHLFAISRSLARSH